MMLYVARILLEDGAVEMPQRQNVKAAREDCRKLEELYGDRANGKAYVAIYEADFLC